VSQDDQEENKHKRRRAITERRTRRDHDALIAALVLAVSGARGIRTLPDVPDTVPDVEESLPGVGQGKRGWSSRDRGESFSVCGSGREKQPALSAERLMYEQLSAVVPHTSQRICLHAWHMHSTRALARSLSLAHSPRRDREVPRDRTRARVRA